MSELCQKEKKKYRSWYTVEGGEVIEFTASTEVIEDITVYAKWNYRVGGFGQAGGYIFYDKWVYSDSWRYLEAAPSVNEVYKPWGGFGTSVEGTFKAIGTGARNTEIIVEKLGTSDSAAKYCSDLEVIKDGFVYSGCSYMVLKNVF